MRVLLFFKAPVIIVRNMDEPYKQIVRQMSPTQKMRTLNSLMTTARAIQRAAIRLRHPDISDADLNRRVREAMLYAKH
jgi:hypothetical protein